MDGVDAFMGLTLTGFMFCGCVLLAGLIALAVYLVKRSVDQVKESEILVNQLLQSVPPDKQSLFFMQYNTTKKNPTLAVILALFLGGIGIHKFYLDSIGIGLLYLIFCWTTIPQWIAVYDAFVIAGQVGKYNQQKAMGIASMLR